VITIAVGFSFVVLFSLRWEVCQIVVLNLCKWLCSIFVSGEDCGHLVAFCMSSNKNTTNLMPVLAARI
jgi:hypothetical protein